MTLPCGHKKGRCRISEHQNEGETYRCLMCCPSCTASRPQKRPRIGNAVSSIPPAGGERFPCGHKKGSCVIPEHQTEGETVRCLFCCPTCKDGTSSSHAQSTLEQQLQQQHEPQPRRAQREAAILSRKRIGAVIEQMGHLAPRDPMGVIAELPSDAPTKKEIGEALRWDRRTWCHLPKSMWKWTEKTPENHEQWQRVSLIIARSVEIIAQSLCPQAVITMVKDVGERLFEPPKKDDTYAVKILSILAELSEKAAKKSIEKRVLNILICKSMKPSFALEIAPAMIGLDPDPPKQAIKQSMVGLKSPRTVNALKPATATPIVAQTTNDTGTQQSMAENLGETAGAATIACPIPNTETVALKDPIDVAHGEPRNNNVQKLAANNNNSSSKPPSNPFQLTNASRARAKEDYLKLVQDGHLEVKQVLPAGKIAPAAAVAMTVVPTAPEATTTNNNNTVPAATAIGTTLTMEQKVEIRIKVLDAQEHLQRLLEDINGDVASAQQRLQAVRKLLQQIAKELP